jgi:hypothetical protein
VTARTSGSARRAASSPRRELVRPHARVLVGERGNGAVHIMTTSLPKVASCLCWPERKPSPRPTSTSSEPTPHAIPNMVRKVRSLLAIMARKTWPRVSEKFCMI